TLPLAPGPTGSTAGKPVLSAAFSKANFAGFSKAGAFWSSMGMLTSVTRWVRGLLFSVGRISTGRKLEPNPRAAAVTWPNRAKPSSNGTGTPSTATTGQFIRIPDDVTVTVPAA